jgi:hypothetical protein
MPAANPSSGSGPGAHLRALGLEHVGETVPSPNSLKSSQTASRIGPMTAFSGNIRAPS